MKKLTTLTLIGAASALALSASAASAQMYDGRHVDARYGERGYGPRADINQRLTLIDRQIARGVRRGQLTQREAQVAQLEMRRIEHLKQQYRSGGFNRLELANLDSRLDRLERQVRYDSHDNQYGYGYGHDYRR